MSREVRHVVVPQRLEKQIFVKCSFCGRDALGPQRSEKEVDWRRSPFTTAETGIFMKTEDGSTSGGIRGTYFVIHACIVCFKEKVIPVLENCALPQGTKFEEVEWEL